jgi:4-hydroxy-tetrahydrodipicolinate reductase
MALSLIVTGARGRMGSTIARLALEDPKFSLAAAIERPESVQGLESLGCPVFTDLHAAATQFPGAVIIDFTAPEASRTHAQTAAATGHPLIVGTTGFSREGLDELTQLAQKIPIFWSPNMSIGINALCRVLPMLERILGADYDLEIVETHHRAKKDAPSGTALKLAQVLAQSRGVDLEQRAVYARHGIIGARTQGEIGIQTLRGGDVVGDHTVFFLGSGERIEVTHRASSRETFARGALRAALWLVGPKTRPALHHGRPHGWGMSITPHAIIAAVGQTVLGKELPIRLALACLLARGHLLIEDIPGIGKTTLAKAMAEVLGLGFTRVQFTNDLLPADILGASVYKDGAFVFHPGPIFTHILLADEINRGTPRTQSALLEAMEERQISIDGTTYPLPEPFCVLATQNAQDLSGTAPLPESQLDRFLVRIHLGYPDEAAELAILAQPRPTFPQPLADAEAVLAMQAEVEARTTSPALLRYVRDLLQWTRQPGRFALGLSPRAGQGLVRMAKAWAYLEGRTYVIPEDVQAIFVAVTEHRLRPLDGGDAAAVLRQVPLP